MVIFRKDFFVLFFVLCSCALHGMDKNTDDKSAKRTEEELIKKLWDEHADELGCLYGKVLASARDFCGDVCLDFLKFFIGHFRRHRKPVINREIFENFLNELKDYKDEHRERRQAFSNRVKGAKNIFELLQKMGVSEVTEINFGV